MKDKIDVIFNDIFNEAEDDIQSDVEHNIKKQVRLELHDIVEKETYGLVWFPLERTTLREKTWN